MKIYNRYSGAVIWDSPCSTLRETVEAAVLANADLANADFACADFACADLTNANLTTAYHGELTK